MAIGQQYSRGTNPCTSSNLQGLIYIGTDKTQVDFPIIYAELANNLQMKKNLCFVLPWLAND